jgi:hypothetical protein
MGVPPAPAPGTDRLFDEIRAQRRRLSPKERADPTWTASDNDGWWVDFFAMCREEARPIYVIMWSWFSTAPQMMSRVAITLKKTKI